MRKNLFFVACTLLGACYFFSCKQLPQQGHLLKEDKERELELYDNPAARDSLEFIKLKDPALGYVPVNRMERAVAYTENLKQISRQNRIAGLTWTERGPISDTVGPSNPNIRDPSNTQSTSGYMTAVLIDTLNDPSGNTVICGGSYGGIWKCTNFLSPNPNWVKINDHNETLSISSLCQDPTSPNVMYYSTGDQYFGTVYNYGAGIWKSTDGGNTWSKLSNSSNFIKSFKIVCDASGNVYLAARVQKVFIPQPYGLFRSKDHGATWVNITPNNLTCDSSCTDVEISSTGRLHASFGFLKTKVNYFYTDDPANVTPSSGWNGNTSIHTNGTSPTAIRMQLACKGNVLYAVTVNTDGNADSCYKSTDGGVTWTLQNTTAYSTEILNTQGDYDITLSINPDNSNEFTIGGLDLYKSSNSGATCNTRLTYWVQSPGANYVHADHHFMQWWKVGTESRIVIGCDGGLFISRDGGQTFDNRNKGLAIKQFYSCAIHPQAGSLYLLGGAQDNGVHSIQDPGLSSSTEVEGGDGAFTHINQFNPDIQYGAYIYNNYERSRDGGKTWQNLSIDYSGLFINPFDVDDGQNILYGSYSNNKVLRLSNADSGSVIPDYLSISQLNGQASAFKVSPYTKDRLYIGTTSGKLLRLDNAGKIAPSSASSGITDLTGASFPNAFLNCINTGSSDQFLVAVFTNFGINNVWYSNNGGTSWSAIDGNLPDMPVRWAVFDPQHDDQLYLATATGVYHTDLVNGSSTNWTPDPGFPSVRTDMLQIRLSDNTMVAATFGRGMFTTVIPSTPELRFTNSMLTFKEKTENSSGCKYYKDYQVNISMVSPPTGDAIATYSIRSGNTATQGLDFDFTTNGDFSNPSNQHVFSNGLAQSKNITIRIYDDTEVEPDETFIIDMSISGSTNAVAGVHSSVACTIISDDVAPFRFVSSSTTVGTQSLSLGNSSDAPLFNAKLFANNAEMLFKASELSAAGVTPGKINSISFNLIKHSTRPYTNFKIIMGTTSAPYIFNNGFFDYATTVVKSLSSYSTVNGWNTFNLDTPFDWDGVSNVVIEICYYIGTEDASNGADAVYAYQDPDATQYQGNFYYQNNIDCSQGFSSVFYYYYGVKPQIQVAYSNNGSIVASTLNASRTEYLGPNSDVYFYSSSGVLMGRIQNLSSFDYGCTQIVIDRAGSASSPFWDNNPSDYLLNKTFRVLPTNNNSSGQYTITLYYSQAEINGWQTATGQNWNNVQMVKTQNAINLVTPSNPNGAGSIMVTTPVIGTFGPDYSLTYTFSNGFSGFGAGVPGVGPLPITLLTFAGHLDHGAGVLEWTTSFEQNAKNFDIERSEDGNSFVNIGSVNATGNSTVERKYSFRDNHLNAVNYYRLRMNDIDGKFKMSQIVLIRFNNTTQNMQVLNNPFHTSIEYTLERPTSKVHLQLFGMNGNLLWQKDVSNPGSRNQLIVTGLSNGSYILKAHVDQDVYTFKLIRQ